MFKDSGPPQIPLKVWFLEPETSYMGYLDLLEEAYRLQNLPVGSCYAHFSGNKLYGHRFCRNGARACIPRRLPSSRRSALVLAS